ncbi:trypsin 3A1-like [Anopheles marshallii]|uniref:trypsin 3A1-like n=1 Tax=Anopheles marshallii TaxID=1521116 RepID=UPI00237BC693|nr:trypsin 3A1-like [Anopheles marshallii]
MRLLVVALLLCVTDTFADSIALQQWRSMQVRRNVRREPGMSGRIIGGYEANIADLPFQLSVRRINYHICGASVVDSSFAITAAHCMTPKPDPEFITLQGGATNRTDDIAGVIFQTEEIIVHPAYNPSTYHNDVALIRIVGTFEGYENVYPIALETVPITSNSLNPVYCTVSGWGLTDMYNGKLPEMLRAVRIPLIPYTDCRRKWSPLAVTTSMICAGEPRRDTCNGDSGGPLVCNDKLYGLVSWGANQCGGTYPGVYTSITSKDVANFIAQYIPV